MYEVKMFQSLLRADQVLRMGEYLMTTSERTAVTPPKGATVIDSDTNKFYVGDGSTAGGVLIGAA